MRVFLNRGEKWKQKASYCFFLKFQSMMLIRRRNIYSLLFFLADPTQPGAIIRSQSNFSADNLYLKWEKSSTSFVNRYKVTVGDQTQYTRGYLPEIQWNSLLMPLTVYKVTITAISYGYTINYPTYGSKESPPSVNSIQTTDSMLS